MTKKRGKAKRNMFILLRREIKTTLWLGEKDERDKH